MNNLYNLDPLLLNVIERSSDFFGVADEQGRAILVNASGRDIFGLGPTDDLSNLTMFDFISIEARAEFEAEIVSKSLVKEKVKRTISVKNFSTGEIFNMDFDFFYIPANEKSRAMFMAFGKDLRKNDAAMKRLNIFEALVENSTDFVGIADNDLKPVYLNPAGREMLGIPPTQNIADVKIEECYPEELRPFAKDEILNGMQKNGSWSGETFFRHFKTEQKIPVHDTHFVIKDPKNGKIIGHATITRDMSKEKSLQKIVESEKSKMLQASKLATLGEMAAGIAHEINNPLAIITGAISALSRGLQDPAQLRKIDMIYKATDRMTRIVKGLRKFSRSSNGLNKSAFSSKVLIDDCFELLTGKASSNRVNLIAEDAKDFTVYADEVQIEQIIINLINNAIDANSESEGAWVKVQSEEDTDFIKFIVQDSGHGIDQSIQEKLFDPFFTTKAVGKGTGLGLSISKGIAKDHGGDLFYQQMGGHTTFVLKVPNRSH